jgi:antitoxin component HigA of HigAB toxin-antitoxin module
MASKPKTLHFTPTTSSCYICGKSSVDFKNYFNFHKHQAEFAAQTGIDGKEAKRFINHYYGQFVDHYSAKFFEFYRQLMELPTPLDHLPYMTIKLEREQQTLQKVFPELRGFDYSQLKIWGFTQIPKKMNWTSAMLRGERNTLGEFKAFCTEVAHDFKNKIVNRGIIRIITEWYDGYEKVRYPIDKPECLDSLHESFEKLNDIIQSYQPEIEFSESKFTQIAKNREALTYTYYLCPVCRHICTSS